MLKGRHSLSDPAVNGRIETVFLYSGLDVKRFAAKTGLEPARMEAIINGTEPVDIHILDAVLKAFPEVNAVYLVTGSGELTTYEAQSNPDRGRFEWITRKMYEEIEDLREKLRVASESNDAVKNYTLKKPK